MLAVGRRLVFAFLLDLIDSAEVKRLALFFGDILLWQIDRNLVNDEDQSFLNSELANLREKGVVKNLGINIPNIIHFGNENGETFSPIAEANKNTVMHMKH